MRPPMHLLLRFQLHPKLQEIADQKKMLLAQLKREAAKLKGETISIANSSDPYPRAEASEGLTRRCLEILVGKQLQNPNHHQKQSRNPRRRPT